MSAFIAALPMYDWPERRTEVDAEWAAIRDRLRVTGVDAPDTLTRDFDDIHELWRRPNLLFAQTCWGPMEQGLAEHVTVLGQQNYDGVEGGQDEFYSSAIVMRRVDLNDRPPSVLPDISPSRGEICQSSASKLPISPLEGEMSGRTEGGGLKQSTNLPLDLLRNARLAYNSDDSMSGIIGLTRDLAALGESLDIFSDRNESGGHRLSIRMIAEGRADVAAIDCMSWALAQQYEPAANDLAVVGWTARRKGLPFITAKATPVAMISMLQDALGPLAAGSTRRVT